MPVINGRPYPDDAVESVNGSLEDATNWHDKRVAAWVARQLQGIGPFTFASMEPSKAQTRLLGLIGLTVPDRYTWAHKMLRKAGYVGTGIPKGMHWSAALRLTDDELLKRAHR